MRVSIISRGYHAEENSRNDEARELEEKLPDVPHIQNPNRIEAAQVAIEELETQLIILDDAMQHRRIGRDFEIVLVDALRTVRPWIRFSKRNSPRTARRCRSGKRSRAHQANLIDAAARKSIRERYTRLAPNAVWVEAAHQPVGLRNSNGEEQPIEQLAHKSVGAFCGIGNPAGFRGTINDCNMNLVELKDFPDHHLYSRDDVEQLNRWASSLPVDAILCTHKDLVKIGLDRLGDKPLWAVRIGMKILEGEEQLAQKADHDSEWNRGFSRLIFSTKRCQVALLATQARSETRCKDIDRVADEPKRTCFRLTSEEVFRFRHAWRPFLRIQTRPDGGILDRRREFDRAKHWPLCQAAIDSLALEPEK